MGKCCSKADDVYESPNQMEGGWSKEYGCVSVVPVGVCAADPEVVCFRGGRVRVDPERWLLGYQQHRLSWAIYQECLSENASLAKYQVDQHDFLLFLKWVYTGRCINPTVEKVALTLGCCLTDAVWGNNIPQDALPGPQQPDEAHADDYIWREKLYVHSHEQHLWSQTIHGWYRAPKAALSDHIIKRSSDGR